MSLTAHPNEILRHETPASALVSPLHKMQSTLPMVSDRIGSLWWGTIGEPGPPLTAKPTFAMWLSSRRVGGRYQTVLNPVGMLASPEGLTGKFMNLIPVNLLPLISLLRFCLHIASNRCAE
jgi:hypothetical protein